MRDVLLGSVITAFMVACGSSGKETVHSYESFETDLEKLTIEYTERGNDEDEFRLERIKYYKDQTFLTSFREEHVLIYLHGEFHKDSVDIAVSRYNDQGIIPTLESLN